MKFKNYDSVMIITRKKIRDKETTRIFLRLVVMQPVCYIQKFFFSILTKKKDNHIQIFYTILLCLAFCICSKLLNNMSKKILLKDDKQGEGVIRCNYKECVWTG